MVRWILYCPVIFILSIAALIVINKGGRDPLTGEDSPDRTKILIVSVYRLGESNTYVEYYNSKSKSSIDIAEFRGDISRPIQWVSNNEANIYLNDNAVVIRKLSIIDDLKLNLIFENAGSTTNHLINPKSN